MKSFLLTLTLSAGINIVNADSNFYQTNDISLFQPPGYSGYFYYPGGAYYDFWWKVQNNTPYNIYGSFDVTSKGVTASWNSLLLNQKEATTPQRGPFFGNPIFPPPKILWRADISYNGRRYITDPTAYQYWFGCTEVVPVSSFAEDPVQMIVYGKSMPSLMLKRNLISTSCIDNLVDMGPVGSFNYSHGATYDFNWTVENDAPYPVSGSFDVQSNGLIASFNNIHLDNKQVTQTGQGPYFRLSSNYWAANLEYDGKRYFAYSRCGIELSDIVPTPTHVFVRGNANGLQDLLIGRPTNWCDPIPFIYMGPAAASRD